LPRAHPAKRVCNLPGTAIRPILLRHRNRPTNFFHLKGISASFKAVPANAIASMDSSPSLSLTFGQAPASQKRFLPYRRYR
jgi:hypothetical protein